MKNTLEKYGLPVLSGILLSWAFPRFHWFWLAWVGLVPLFWTALRSNPRGAAGQFFLAGWVFHSLLLQWLWANIFWAGGWAILGQQLLCVLLALHWAAVGFIWIWLIRRHPDKPMTFAMPLLWWGMEWLIANWFSGFGWSALGYTQGACLPIAQWAAESSVSVISMLVVFVNLLLTLAVFERPRLVRLAMAGALMAIILGGGYLSLMSAGPRPDGAKLQPFKVGLVQPSLSQEIKWDRDFNEFIENMLETQTRALSKEGPLDLVVWPEAAVPGDLSSKKTMEPLRQLTRDTGASLLTGITRDDLKTQKSYNSACLLTPQGEVTGVYDKVHLAPFGEYVPFGQWLPFLRSIAFGGVDAGTELKVFQVGDHKAGPLICFEVLFTPLAKELKRQGADFLVVMTNLAWFGQSNAMLQELEMARFRAIETGLPMIHCGNTGISGVFDGSGRFAPVSAYARRDGSLMQYPVDRMTPAMVQSQRLVGTFTLPPPVTGYPLEGFIVFFIYCAIIGFVERRFICQPHNDKNKRKQ